jgi:hypothetical protein
MKNIEKFEDFAPNSKVNEGADIPKLVTLIDKAIAKVDSNLSYKDFAKAVALVLEDAYGSHNYKPFVKQLEQTLKNL